MGDYPGFRKAGGLWYVRKVGSYGVRYVRWYGGRLREGTNLYKKTGQRYYAAAKFHAGHMAESYRGAARVVKAEGRNIKTSIVTGERRQLRNVKMLGRGLKREIGSFFGRTYHTRKGTARAVRGSVGRATGKRASPYRRYRRRLGK